jgi:xylulokinase
LVPSNSDDIGHVATIRALSPDAYERTVAFVEPMDYVAARLTGTITATQNTMFPMLAVDNRVWNTIEYSDELLALSGLDRSKLPPLVPLGRPRGTITAAAAAHLGVSPRATVMGATIDSVTTAVGTGAVDSTRCGLVVGTTTVIATHLPSKRLDAQHGLTSAPSPLPDSWFLVAENGLGGKALDVFVNQIVFPDDGLTGPRPADAFERVLAAAAEAPVGAHGVMFFPWLIGAMAPSFERNQRGGFAGLGLTSDRRDMARAVLEGVALNAAWLLPHVSALAGHDHAQVTLGGGGAASPLWGQILADCFGVPVRRLAGSSSTNAHGAALLALAEAGHASLTDLPTMLRTAEVHDPVAAHHRTYQQLLAAFVDFHDRAAPFYANFPSSSTKDPEP